MDVQLRAVAVDLHLVQPPGPSGARSRKVGSHGWMNPGNGARFAPAMPAIETRLFRRFNVSAHMRTQSSPVDEVPWAEGSGLVIARWHG
jgi:hypothetical protein